MILKKNEQITEEFPWGKLVWYASKQLSNSDYLTLGHCMIKPKCQNSVHYHDNCDEILHVLKGTIKHQYEGEEDVVMEAGDSITIPKNIKHCAINIGDTEAVLLISFSSNNRRTIHV